MAKPRKDDPQVEELLQRTREAIRRSQELIAKARELQERCNQLKGAKPIALRT